MNNLYRPYEKAITYGVLGMTSKDNVNPKDPVLATSYCSALSARALRNSTLETFWGYTATILSGALVATGAIWGATKDDNPSKRAALAFPIAGGALVPLGTYLLSRSSDNSKLAAEAAAGIADLDPGTACNQALVRWHQSRSGEVANMNASLEKKRPKTPGETIEAQLDALDKRADELAATVTKTAAPMDAELKSSVSTESKEIREQADYVQTSLSQLSTAEQIVPSGRIAGLLGRVTAAEKDLATKATPAEKPPAPTP